MPQPFTIEFETAAFNRNLNQFLRNVTVDKVPLAIKKFAAELLRRIIMKMPVDTGRARAAWYMSTTGLGVRFNFGTKGPLVASKKIRSTEGIESGMSEGDYVENLKGLTPYVEMVNGCPYIIFLEYGWSGQAPWGMVRISMREMRGGQLPQQMMKVIRDEWNKFFWRGANRGVVV